MPAKIEYAAFRQEVVRSLAHELFGPLHDDNSARQLEVLTVTPLQIYGTGILFPQKHVLEEREETAQSESSSADDVPDVTDNTDNTPEVNTKSNSSSGSETESISEQSALNLANEYSPSAMGITVKTDSTDRLLVSLSFATYTRSTVDIPHPKAGQKRSDGTVFPDSFTKPSFTRVPVEVELPVQIQRSSFYVKKHKIEGSEDGLRLHVRQARQSDATVVTLMVVNENMAGPGHTPDVNDSYFQVCVAVKSASGASVFVPIDKPSGVSLGNEAVSLALQYRNRRSFGLGHGCAADWERNVEVDRSGRNSVVRTACIPKFEMYPVVPREQPFGSAELNLNMRDLSALADSSGQIKATILNSLLGLADDYSLWLDEQEKVTAQLDVKQCDAAILNLEKCRQCEARIRNGIRVLESNDNAMSAFRLANHAMLMQQFHSKLPRRKLTSEFPEIPDGYATTSSNVGRWRPFQLAFILMNIEGIVFPETDDHEIVDLIWFPTGGGKTEAYLGLAAFVIALRRISDRENAGVAVLMRYTLRLLTAQQFERASALVLALETLRRTNPLDIDLGDGPISIGLWVGESLSPNHGGPAVRQLRKWRDREQAKNPFQVLNCPWCGVEFTERTTPGYVERRLENGDRTVSFRCPDKQCDWSGDDSYLPIQVIDDDIYDSPPSILLGTVDKFAQLSWVSQTGRLFGVGTTNTPPEFIIQDELHLISGPLGTIVGLYETVIDRLCQGSTHGPKIVASTATIQRAADQCRSLYARQSFEFPPAAVDAGETYFAFEDREAPGRLYVGIFASGVNSHATAQVRTCSALLQAPQSILPGATGDSEKITDTYGTLVWYFNSLRELGHAATLCTGDIPEHLKSLCNRNQIDYDDRRRVRSVIELTSRRTADEIPDVLKQLGIPWTPKPEGQYPVDILLSTSMISVGVDVGRLGLMVVTGQPKGTAEYIQATSRVGRSNPGLVVTAYNQTKSRDRSHYEQFVGYHQSIYRFVEPTSLTPFSPPARDRGFSGLLMALAQHLCEIESPDQIDQYIDRLTEEKARLLDRIGLIDPEERIEAEFELDRKIAEWRQVKPPAYGSMAGTPKVVTLAYPYGSRPHPDLQKRSWPALTSMRNVDATCEGRVVLAYLTPDENEER